MRLKLYCNRYTHFKDAIVCSVSCAYRTRCHDFALFYDGHREEVDALVADYYAGRREGERREAERPPSSRLLPLAPVAPTVLARPEELRNLIRLEVKRKMTEAYYIWVDREDRAELLDTAEVLKRAERGHKAKSIYRVSQEMELRYQLVPRKRIEKAKRVAAEDAERAAARRTRRSAGARPAKPEPPPPVPFPAPVVVEDRPTAAAQPARRRARAGK